MIVLCGRCGASAPEGSTRCRCVLVVTVVRCTVCGLLRAEGSDCPCGLGCGTSRVGGSQLADVVQTAVALEGRVTSSSIAAAARALRERAS